MLFVIVCIIILKIIFKPVIKIKKALYFKTFMLLYNFGFVGDTNKKMLNLI